MGNNINSKKTLHIIYALKSGGGENIIKTFHNKGDLCISLTNNSCLEGIQHKRIPLRIQGKSRYYNLSEYIKSIPSLIILLCYLINNKNNYRLVFHGFPFQFLTFLILINKKNKIYFVYHQFKKKPKFIKGFFSVNLERLFLNISTRINIVGVSPWVIENIQKLFKPMNKIFILNLPINIKISTNSSIKLDKINNFLIYGARLVEEKGQLRLLKEVNKMRIYNPKINTIIFCGSGNKKNEIYNYAKKLKQFNILIFDNLKNSDYLYLLKKSSGFLFPSYREAFPLSLLEAILLSKKTFIWEDYLHKFYKDCSYKSIFLELFLRGEKLPILAKKEKRIQELKKIYLKNKNFIKSIKKYN